MPPELLVAIVFRLPLQRHARREQCRCGFLRGGVLLNGLEVIENPEGASVRCHEQRIVARMNRQLVDTHGGKVGLEATPACAAIERQEDARFRADVEHVRVARVFRERAHILAAQIAVE